MIVASIHQILCYLRALTIQIVGIKHHSLLQHTLSRIDAIQNLSHRTILYVVVHTTQKVRNTRMKRIYGSQLLASDKGCHIHARAQIAQILHL